MVGGGQALFHVAVAEEGEEAGHLVHEEGEVLAAHQGAELLDALGSEELQGRLLGDLVEILVVVDDRGQQRDELQLRLAEVGRGGALDDLLELFLHHLAQLAGVGADGALQLHVLADDVVHIAAVELADGQNQGIYGVVDAGDKGLQRHHDGGSRDDGVMPVLGRGAVGLQALDMDLEVVHGGHAVAAVHADIGGVQGSPDVQAEDGVHTVQHAVLHIVLRAVADLLGRLEDELHLAASQLVLHVAEDLGRTQEHGHVVVVAAGVHDAVVLRGKGQAGALLDGQGVDVRAEHDGLAGAAGVQRGDEAGVVREGLHLQAHGLHVLHQGLGGLKLLEAQFRVLMVVSASLDDIRGVLLRKCSDVHFLLSFALKLAWLKERGRHNARSCRPGFLRIC